MAERLVMKYDEVNMAISAERIAGATLDTYLTGLNKAVAELGPTFKGKAASKFLGWWNGNGKKHHKAIVNQLNTLADKLEAIQMLTENADAELAASFSTTPDLK